MSNLKHSHYYSQQWAANIQLFVGPFQSFVKFLKKRFHVKWQQSDDINCAGMAFRMVNSKGIRIGYGIYMPELTNSPDNIVTLSHQCIHLASDILMDRNVCIDDQNKEALTYTHDAIFRKFLGKVK